MISLFFLYICGFVNRVNYCEFKSINTYVSGLRRKNVMCFKNCKVFYLNKMF